tara:strand:- start:397 stop:1239 length:843 start_codon:yes stop_codon:yes gene_type:complete
MPNLDNPLRRHFRQPVIHLRLPSGGRFYPPGALNMPPNGELPVLPMTAVDEIVTRTPDALFNGSAIPDIISSCIPAIRDPWAVPSVDLNAILVAMRLASYGHKMDVTSTCPGCKNNNEFDLDLRIIMDSLKTPDYDTPLVLGDLTIAFMPLSYRQINQNSQMQFEDQKLMQALNSTDMDTEQRLAMLSESFKKITALTIRAIAVSISSIQTPDAIVTEPEFILEFLNNCEKDMFQQIRDHAIALRQAGEIKPLDITCSECSQKYTQDFSLDMSNFFEINS